MRDFLIIVLIFQLFFTSCNLEKKIKIKQIASNENILIYKSFRNVKSDSISLDIPIEFDLNINEFSDVRSFIIYYYSNQKYLSNIIDYKIYSKENLKIIYAIEELNPKNIPNKILIRSGNYLISEEDAKLLLKKYNKTNKLLKDLKFGDTIKIIPLNQFRMENKNIINELSKANDSIIFRINLDKDNPILVKQKINWWNEIILLHGLKRFDFTQINQEILNKLLKGEIKTIEQLRELKYIEKQSKPSTIYTLFYTEVYDQDLEKYITTIDSIFINS